jgi:hypothetical protein
MAAFREYQEDLFRARLVEQVRELFPDAVEQMGDEAVRELISSGMERAKGYQLMSARNITLFVDMLFGLGEDFEEQVAHLDLVDFLQDDSLDEDAKMYLVYSRLTESSPHAAAASPEASV